MRGLIIGEVVDVKDASWTNAQGQRQEQRELFIRQDGSSLAYGADRVTAAPEIVAKVGDRVALVVAFRARNYKSGNKAGEAYLSAYAVKHYAEDQAAA